MVLNIQNIDKAIKTSALPIKDKSLKIGIALPHFIPFKEKPLFLYWVVKYKVSVYIPEAQYSNSNQQLRQGF